MLGPAERSERRYLRNYDNLDDDNAHGGADLGGGDGTGKGSSKGFPVDYDSLKRLDRILHAYLGGTN